MKQLKRRTLAMILAMLLAITVVTPIAAIAEEKTALPAQETVEETPAEEDVEEAPAEEVIDETPAEEIAEESPVEEETIEEIPAEEEDVEESSAEEEGVEEAPAEEVIDETPAEEIAEESPVEEETIEEIPAEEEGVEEAPAEEVIDETPTEEIAEESPVEEETIEEIPAEEEDVEEAPAEEVIDETPTEEIAEEAPAVPAAASDADEGTRNVEIQVGEYVITICGAFPEGMELEAVEIPRDAAAKMTGQAPLFAYDIRLVKDGDTWQPEDYGKDVQMYLRNVNEDMSDVQVEILHVKTSLLDEESGISREALAQALLDLENGSVDTETISAETCEDGFDFGTSSFSAFVGNTDSKVVYVYNAKLYDEASGKYAGVYTTKLTPNTATAEEAKTTETIGIPSIADANLPDVPTTESPAIIQGAAVGYEKKTGATTFELLDPDVPRPEPYNEFTVKALDEQAADGTTHTKLSGFDGTYVIVRLDVSEFFGSGADADSMYLHMEQKDNKALMPAATVAKPAADAATTVNPADYTPTNMFTDGLGNRSASYKLSELLDPGGTTPYVDVILYATAANVAGADAGKENVANGDVPLAFYVDGTLQYNSELVEYDPNNTANVDPNADANDPNAKTSTAYDNAWHAKFFNVTKAAAVSAAVSRYVMKGSDLALETMVENSAGDNKDSGTTYWSLQKALENAYYDQEIDKSPKDQGSGRTVKLMSEVAVTEELTLQGTDENNLKKRTLDVNSFDIQIASNTNQDAAPYTDGFTLSNAWLTIADNSNTTGAEMAIGNNAHFVIDQGGKLIIDNTCQLEIEWDGATTTSTGNQQTQPAQQDVLNNGLLDLRAGGEVINNGILTIEGTEGKPYQPGSGTEQQTIDSEKGMGEMTIREGATLTNNGSMVVYGKLYNLGTLVNNGKYNDVISSNDPDKGAFDYHKGIQVSWKDDVTQRNIEPGALINGKDKDGNLITTAILRNNGDIVLMPGTLENNGKLFNNRRANVFSAAATEAIIPITPDPATPTIVSKRITLDPAKLSFIINNGTWINRGNIAPATVALNDNIGFGALTTPGHHPELFGFTGSGVLINITGNGNVTEPNLVAALYGSEFTAEDTWLYLYDDDTFRIVFADGAELAGTYKVTDKGMVFTLEDGTVIEPEEDENGNYVYRIELANKTVHEVVIGKEDIRNLKK